MKKGLIATTLSLFSLSFVSALGFGGYNNFGFGGLFSSFNIENLLEVLFFAVLFAVLYWAIGRTPLRDSTITRWIVALGISAFTFYGISSSGFSLSEFLFQFGFDADILPTIIWMISILILLFLLIKFKLRKTFAIIFSLGGAFFVILTFFGYFYNGGASIAIGIFLLLVSAFLFKKKEKLASFGEKRRIVNSKTYKIGKKIGYGAAATGYYGLKGAKTIGKYGWKGTKLAAKKTKEKYTSAQNERLVRKQMEDARKRKEKDEARRKKAEEEFKKREREK